MTKTTLILMALFAFAASAVAQNKADGKFRLVLPDHRGQLMWTADGFKVIQSSAKPGGREIGIRGKDASGRLTFLGFLFLFSEQAPLTSAKCRDGVVDPLKKENPKLEFTETLEKSSAGNMPIAVARYEGKGRDGKVHAVRGFVASGDICGDLEVYSDSPIGVDDAVVKKILESYHLEENYIPQFEDVLLYAQILYQAHMYKAAAPFFETALVKVNENPDSAAKIGWDAKTARRLAIDQAGMAYGMSGDIPKARRLFEKAIVDDPDYPLNYYNLACADAEEKNLAGAQTNLQKAFARKANVLAGEKMPDPTKDDSFLPYRNNKEFWTFLKSLQPN